MGFDRSNTEEFLSFLGTCMTFYNMHLTPYEQNHVIAEMGKLLHDHLAQKNYAPLVNSFMERVQQDMLILTHAVMRGGDTDGDDQV